MKKNLSYDDLDAEEYEHMFGKPQVKRFHMKSLGAALVIGLIITISFIFLSCLIWG